MARGFLNIAGGLLTGIGQGIVAQDAQAQKRGLEERDARRRELERQQDQQFRASERMAGQDFTAAQAEASRAAQADQAAASQLQAERLQAQRLEADAEQKRLDRDMQMNDPLRRAQAKYYESGGSAGQKLVPVEVDDPANPGQKITVYKTVADAADQRVAPRSGAGGRDSVYEQKRRAWLAIHPDDESGALDYAAGKKVMNNTSLYDMASQIVNRENAGSLVPMKPEARKTRVDQVYEHLQSLDKKVGEDKGAQSAPPPVATPTEPRTVAPAGNEPAPAAPASPPNVTTGLRTDPAEVQRLRDRAKQAIADGGNPAAVRQRFKQLTGQEL